MEPIFPFKSLTKKLSAAAIGLVLLMSFSPNDSSYLNATNDEREAGKIEVTSILGSYKTKINAFYKKQYGTIQYSTLEIKADNKAEVSVITDNTDSSLPSESCAYFKTTDYMSYKVIDGNKLEFTCIKKIDEACDKVKDLKCFTYVLDGSIKENSIQIGSDLFVKQ